MPKNKKQSPFMIFTMEYKKKFPNLRIEQAVSEAGTEWKKMSEQEKSYYKNRAKKNATVNNNPREKYTSQGVPISQLDKERNDAALEERQNKKETEDFIVAGRDSNTLSTQRFYFLMANYFVRNAELNVYLPAEIGLCEFSLENGITNKYHSFVNPGDGLFGHAFEAIEHAKNSHNLPLPPDALGEKNLSKLYLDIFKFIQSKNENPNRIPPVYVMDSSLHILKSILNYLHEKCDFEVPPIRVLSLHYLFYYLKKTTAEIGDTKYVDSIHITNAILNRDYYEYQSGIACSRHEKDDRTNYCALSYVIRWAYTFADNICMDLGIILKAGVHLPLEADLSVINKDNSCITTEHNFNDTESICSNTSWSTNCTEPNLENSFDKNSSFSSTGEHFPKLNNDDQVKDLDDADRTLNETINGIENIDIQDDDNPWLIRYKKKPREPTEDSFHFNGGCSYRGRGINLFKKNDDTVSEASVPTSSGRGLQWNDSCSSLNSGIGRGRLFK